MTSDPLLSDDLAELLRAFPNDALCDLVAILKQHQYWSVLPANRAYEAHKLPPNGNFRAHARAIAEEVIWWGSNDFGRQFLGLPSWLEVVTKAARHLDVKADLCASPAWRIEEAIFLKACEQWEALPPEARKKLMDETSKSFESVYGMMAATTGGIVAQVGARQLLTFLAARGAGGLVPVVGPLMMVLGTAWTFGELAGPAYRVLRPATLCIAFHRRRLRDARLAAAFKE